MLSDYRKLLSHSIIGFKNGKKFICDGGIYTIDYLNEGKQLISYFDVDVSCPLSGKSRHFLTFNHCNTYSNWYEFVQD